MQEVGFAFDVEILARARTLDLCVAEAPVHWESRPGSTVSTFGDPLRMTGALLRMGGRADLPGVHRLQLRRALITSVALILLAGGIASGVLGLGHATARTAALFLGGLAVLALFVVQRGVGAGWLGARGAAVLVVPTLFACGLFAGRALSLTGHAGDAVFYGMLLPLPALLTTLAGLRLRSVPLVVLAFGLGTVAAIVAGLHALIV